MWLCSERCVRRAGQLTDRRSDWTLAKCCAPKEAFRWGGLFYHFILLSFLPLIPSPTCLLQEAMMSGSSPFGDGHTETKKGKRGGHGLCVCWCVYVWVREGGLFISNPVFYFLHVLTHTMTLNSISLSFAPPLPSLSLSHSLPVFCSVSFNEMNFSSLHASV